MRLYELHKKSGTFYETDHKYLYHMTDSHGFSYTVQQNSLQGLRQGYVSTTYDPKKNGVYGYQHYDFKFVMDGKKLVETYGGFNYDHKIQVGDSRKLESLDEREIGIETKAIEPFTDYLLGTVLLFDLFSQRALQWLMYDNRETESFLGPTKSAAPRAIEALYTHMIEWKKPVWMSTGGDGMRKPTDAEMKFLKDVLAIHKRGGDFAKSMRTLAAKYSIKDHSDTILDKQTVVRRQMAPKIYGMLNKYYQNRPFSKVDPVKVREMISKSLGALKLNGNISSVVMGALESHGLFHQAIAPVDWGIILKPLMDGDVDLTLEAIDWVAKDKAWHIKHYNDDPASAKYSRHAGTRF